MARQPRSESPDAILHVYSRGNYRTDIFADPGAAGSFLTSMHEATLRSGWHLYTFAVMPNHFHMMLRTPRANLARGDEHGVRPYLFLTEPKLGYSPLFSV